MMLLQSRLRFGHPSDAAHARKPPPPTLRERGSGLRQAKGTRRCCRASLSVPIAAQMDPSSKPVYMPVEPYDSGFLKVSDVHTIYYEQSENPQGHAAMFLHGGPGAGTSPDNRRFFDPEFYKIVLFDQFILATHLFFFLNVFDGSWGSTLALAYSQEHPDKVTGLVLRGIFLLRKQEFDWLYEGGAAAIFPDAWEPFRDFIPEDERNCFVDSYNKRLTSSNPIVLVAPHISFWK
ncbi:Proline iminopeptidase [Zea mays]|uniref:Proline iminopeptidase n=1 Tax=Zea mays TaxID=4577 RepID=A0A3L6FKR4_MAIZE|nr:Proline iminopeptidase [Zea mays]